MDDTIRDVEMSKIKQRANTQEQETRYGKADILIDIPENEQRIWDEESEERGMYRSTMVRAYAAVGKQLLEQHHPKVVLEPQRTLKRIIEQNVPKSEKSAENIEEIAEKVIDDVEEEILAVLAKSDQIHQLGDQFYRSK